MSFFTPRPTESHIYQEFVDIEGDCPECGEPQLKRYDVLRGHGWHSVVRCRACFHDVSAEATQQSYVPLTAGWPTSSAG